MRERSRSGDIVVREAREEDIGEMHRIRLAVRENRLSDPASVQPDDYRALMRSGGHGWVAEVDGRVAGFAVGDRSDSSVWALFVDPSYERRGLGRRLHEPMMDWLFDAGADLVWLGTDPGTRAARFYEAAGWIHVGSQENGESRYEMTRERWRAEEPT